MRKKWKKRIEELEANLKNSEEQIRILEFRQRAGNRNFLLTKERYYDIHGIFGSASYGLYIEVVRDKKLVKERICDVLNSENFALINDKYLEIWDSDGENLNKVYEIYADGSFNRLPCNLYKEAKYPRSAKMRISVEIK